MMLEMFERLVIAGVPFVTVVCLGLYIEQRWIGLPRRKQASPPGPGGPGAFRM